MSTKGRSCVSAACAIAVLSLAGCAANVDGRDPSSAAAVTSTPGTYSLYFTNPLTNVLETAKNRSKRKFNPVTDPEDAPLSDTAIKRLGTLATHDVAGGRELANALVELIDSAKPHVTAGKPCTVFLAGYEFDREDLAEALARSKKRQCDVRLVTDGTTIAKSEIPGNEEYKVFQIIRNAKIPIHHDGKRRAIMHNKFVVVTGEGVDAVWTGSWNFTTSDEQMFWNHGIRINSAPLAELYRKNFAAMEARFGTDGSVQPALRRSRATELADPSAIQVGQSAFQVFFPGSSADSAIRRITDILSAAKESIHILAFAFTSAPMTQAITLAATRAPAGKPLDIRGVFETSGACRGAFSVLSQQVQGPNQLLRWTYGPTHFMHDKVFIVDKRFTVFGSYNFSDSADRSNEENVLISDDKAVAASFEEAFETVHAATSLFPQPNPCGSGPSGEPPLAHAFLP